MDRKNFILIYGIFIVVLMTGTAIYVNVKMHGNPQVSRAHKVKLNLSMAWAIVGTMAGVMLIYLRS